MVKHQTSTHLLLVQHGGTATAPSKASRQVSPPTLVYLSWYQHMHCLTYLLPAATVILHATAAVCCCNCTACTAAKHTCMNTARLVHTADISAHLGLCSCIKAVHALQSAAACTHACVNQLPRHIPLLAEGVLAELDADGSPVTAGQHSALHNDVWRVRQGEVAVCN